MSSTDDFMADVASAVDTGNAPEAAPVEIQTDTKVQQKPQDVKPDVSQEISVASELDKMFDDATPADQKPEVKEPEKKETLTLKKDDDAEETNDDDDDIEASQQQKEKNPFQPKKQRRAGDRALDTFLNEDDKGNLINNDGDIIALAGKSRNHFEAVKKEGRAQRKAAADLAIQNMELAGQFKSLYDEYKAEQGKTTDPIQNIVKDTGFSDAEATQAINIMKQYKANPIEAIKNLLTQAHNSGIDVSQLGTTITADPRHMRQEIQTMINESLAPVSENAQNDKAVREAQQEAHQFLTRFPDALPYQEAIGQAKIRFPDMSLPEIWLRLSQELAKHSQTNQQQSDTKHRKQAKKLKKPVSKVQIPDRDYSTLGFDEIAKSIEKDYAQ